MPKKKKLTQNEKNLMRRYLMWCYKTTKEDLDRIDRYFTQSVVDQLILKDLQKSKDFKKNGKYKKQVDAFAVYMETKTEKAQTVKFADKNCKEIKGEYLYSVNRFKAIEKVIVSFFGKKGLLEIEGLYEEEMSLRILEAKEHT